MSVAALKIPSMVEELHKKTSIQETTSPTDHHSMLSDRPSMISDCPSMVVSVSPTHEHSEKSSKDSGEESPASPTHIKKRGKRKKYQKYTPEDRFAIGKYCFEHGPAAARKAFQERYPEMSESVTRGFRDKYKLIIGETAVYEFEQQRQRDYQRRTGPLPRGRPRKYKAVEEDEEMSASMVVGIPSPTSVNYYREEEQSHRSPSHPVNSPSNKSIDAHFERSVRNKEKLEGDYERKDNFKSDGHHEYTLQEQLKIGKSCARDGLNAALKRFKVDHPDLKEELIISFHKKYLETEGVTTNAHPKVFILESDQSEAMNTRNSSDGHISHREIVESDAIDFTSPFIPKTRNENIKKKSYEQISSFNHVQSRHRMENGRRDTITYAMHDAPLRAHSPSNYSSSHANRPSSQVVSVVSSRVSTPAIIHYPKVSVERTAHYPDYMEERIKREYSAAMDVNNTSYSFDKHCYKRSPPPDDFPNNPGLPTRAKRFKYQKYTPEDRYNIGKLCNEIGLGATVKVYREQFPRLNESVVRTFRNKYRELLQRGNGTATTEAIQRKPSRRSISSLVESEVVSQLRQFKISKIDLTEKLVLAVCENVLSTKDPHEVVGIRTQITNEWANSLLWKHKLVEKPLTNVNNVCCSRCQSTLICPKCN